MQSPHSRLLKISSIPFIWSTRTVVFHLAYISHANRTTKSHSNSLHTIAINGRTLFMPISSDFSRFILRPGFPENQTFKFRSNRTQNPNQNELRRIVLLCRGFYIRRGCAAKSTIQWSSLSQLTFLLDIWNIDVNGVKPGISTLFTPIISITLFTCITKHLPSINHINCVCLLVVWVSAFAGVAVFKSARILLRFYLLVCSKPFFPILSVNVGLHSKSSAFTVSSNEFLYYPWACYEAGSTGE